VRRVRVDLGPRSYTVAVGAGILDGLGAAVARLGPGRRALVVADAAVAATYGAAARQSLEGAGLTAALATLPSGEASKTLGETARLYDAALDAGLDRRSWIVAVGGGVTGDVAGFAAATFLRGVPFVQVPTTLLAQVDASVGGKVAVDHPRGKNLIGAFHQPSLVWADVATLDTLPAGELRSGLAEAVKHGVLADAGYLAMLRRRAAVLLAGDREALARVVAGSVRIKAAVVAADEREEGGPRSHLNLGHTVGHALEAALDFGGLRHGEAVAIGMVAAGRLALGRGLWSEAWQAELVDLLGRLGLPTAIPAVSAARIMGALKLDKKSREGRVRWVLPVRPGAVTLCDAVEPAEVGRLLLSMGALP
jgi:3-dehydroquinate synthase